MSDELGHSAEEYWQLLLERNTLASAGSRPNTVPVNVRTFDTGATRDTDTTKIDPEGFLAPQVIQYYCEFMHKNRVQADGQLRASDNWQRGIPRDVYMKSGWRHFLEWWTLHRTPGSSIKARRDAVCALLFNAMGYLYEDGKADTGEK